MTTVPAQGDLPPLSDERILEAFRDVIGAGLEGRFERLSQAIQFARAIERLAIELSRRQEAPLPARKVRPNGKAPRAWTAIYADGEADGWNRCLDAIAAGRQEASEPVAPDACICKGNWRAIVNETERLIGRKYRGHDGEIYRFFGIVHGEDDYYYGMQRDGQMWLLSCVGSIEGHGYAAMPESPKAGE